MIDVVLVGIEGYASSHFEAFLKRAKQGKVRIVGVVNPYSPKKETLNKLQEFNIPHFKTLESFYQNGRADLVNIASPIQFHCEQTCLALSNGSHVLCEKPLAATTVEVMEMMNYRDKTNLKVGIGYQWIYSSAFQQLKMDFVNGKFGKPKRLKSIVLWPRPEKYFHRSWAGKIKDDTGRWVLDSVTANATAHFLQNMFYIIGKSMNESQLPLKLVAESYRANHIENYDTSAIRTITDEGVEILFLASHAIQKNEVFGPEFEYEFENAVVKFTSVAGEDQNLIKAYYSDGTVDNYGSPFADDFLKIDHMLAAINVKNKTVDCSIEVASSHTLCISGIQQSVPSPVNFPKEKVHFDSIEQIVWVDQLSDVLKHSYKKWKMPHELKVNWAISGEVVSLERNELYRILKNEST
ncbi:Gfo/Idh/MocA family protein [Halalkalibacter akibai]|uniref:PHT4-related protein n=1 Tax=Halalkalibacter akibai (strain ATCC 43226 / DSM 21942 / CIP 109018 / JCM 9157 / 1139) TaxID=1236973 RepID=W4QV69_HALA3|nr:Gfo/Idh/MocA family oxidoreductase [Halalkalibacter akibai]GAE35234.1 PHT4-related protein [Halalkalibacter akibai JCM 9157]